MCEAHPPVFPDGDDRGSLCGPQRRSGQTGDRGSPVGGGNEQCRPRGCRQASNAGDNQLAQVVGYRPWVAGAGKVGGDEHAGELKGEERVAAGHSMNA